MDANNYLVITICSVIAVFFIIGLILGITNKIVVFNEYRDVVLSFGGVVFSFLFIASAPKEKNDLEGFYILFGLVESILLLFIFRYTLKSNDNIFKTLYAFLIKIPLSLIFMIMIMGIGGKADATEEKKSSDRNRKLIEFGLFAALILGLIRNHKWKVTKTKI